MRLRLGLAVGFGAGYYFGAKAGRERYQEMDRVIRRVRRSDAYRTTVGKARAAVDLGVERARGVVEERKGGGVPSAANGTAPAPAGRPPVYGS